MLGADVIFAISLEIVDKSIGLNGLDLFNIVAICNGFFPIYLDQVDLSLLQKNCIEILDDEKN